MDLTKIFGWILIGLSVVLMLDAALAAIFGERYMRWGLNYFPAGYSDFMIKIYEGPKIILWGAILAEFVAGVGLFWMARKLVITYPPL